jgi:rubrerythrin
MVIKMDKGFKGGRIPADFSGYASPIAVEIARKQEEDLEKALYTVLETYNITVDKDELLKALSYDRNQYEAGYKAGYKAAQGEQRIGTWIVHGIYARCSECKETGGTILNGDKPEPMLTKFCPNCGAKMRKVAVRLEEKA